MLNITLFRGCILDAHNSRTVAGLSYLAAQKRINLKISWHEAPQLKNRVKFDRFTFWVQVEEVNTGRTRNICFDTQDDCGFHYPELLKACDIYFKRSYRQDYVKDLPQPLRNKVRPYGFNYACSSPYWKYDLFLRISSLLYNKVPPITKIKQSYKLFKSYMGAWVPGFQPPGSFFNPPLSSAFEATPNSNATPQILFQTRAWDPKKQKWLTPENLKNLNDFRADTIRALRRKFGANVIAGFCADDYALSHYPDCITPQSSDKQSYISLLRNSTICVQTIGLYGSTGWKLAEYFAAGKCIVSEPILDVLPTPVQEEKHILTFTNSDECVSACQRLLDDQVLANKMSNNNFLYYLSEIEPSAHIYKCLSIRTFSPEP